MLAVDREDATAAPPLRSEGEVACGDEALLVRERKVDTVFERPQRRVDAGKPDDRVEDDVGLSLLEELGYISAHLFQWSCDVVERRRPGRDGAQLETGVRLDDLDCLAPDRAGGAEEGDAFHE